MIIKPRTESKELIIMRYLNSRLTLSSNDKQHYMKLEKGYQGELHFDTLSEVHLDNYLLLNDLTFEHNNSTFQIDSLLLSDQTVHLCEIKNYTGDFYNKDGLWYTSSDKEIRDPVLQLKRAESLLRSMLQEHRSKFSVSANVVFVNSEFTLYYAPMDLPMIFPSQLYRFFKKFNQHPSLMKKDQLKLANQLLDLQVDNSTFSKIPTYEYEQLQKGITCRECRTISVTVFDDTCLCQNCGFKEDLEAVVLRSVEEFVTLFPDKKITTNGIHEWCQLPYSRKVLRKILKKHFRSIGLPIT